MRTVIVESPFSGRSPLERSTNIEFARRCIRDALRRGEAPFASHLLYAHVLDDDRPEDRRLGMAAGLTIGGRLELTAVYMDRGISTGMADGIREAVARSRPIEFRTFDGHDADALARAVPWHEACAMSPTVSCLLAIPIDDR